MNETRKAHKNSVFIINPLSAKSIWVKVKFWVKIEFWVKVKFWVKAKFWVMVMVKVCVVASRWSMSVCVWLHLASPDVSVVSAAYRINSLIYTVLDDTQASKHGKLI